MQYPKNAEHSQVREDFQLVSMVKMFGIVSSFHITPVQ